MWTRSKLKEVAKAALHRNYWKIVLVSVILMLLYRLLSCRLPTHSER